MLLLVNRMPVVGSPPPEGIAEASFVPLDYILQEGDTVYVGPGRLEGAVALNLRQLERYLQSSGFTRKGNGKVWENAQGQKITVNPKKGGEVDITSVRALADLRGVPFSEILEEMRQA